MKDSLYIVILSAAKNPRLYGNKGCAFVSLCPCARFCTNSSLTTNHYSSLYISFFPNVRTISVYFPFSEFAVTLWPSLPQSFFTR